MARNSADSDILAQLLAEGTEREAEDIIEDAQLIEIEDPQDADWEPLDEDWEESPGHQEY